MTIKVSNGDIIDFSLENGSILFSSRTGVVVTGSDLSYDLARQLNPELLAQHTALYPYFAHKVGEVDDPNLYKYLAYKLPNGVMEIVGYPWIKDSTLQTVTTRIKTYTITNFKEEFRAPIQTFLENLGAQYTSTEETNV